MSLTGELDLLSLSSRLAFFVISTVVERSPTNIEDINSFKATKGFVILIIKKSQYQMHYYVYILTNSRNSVLYVGVTSNLQRRLYEHLTTQYNSFCRRYNINKLVYFEESRSSLDAIQREKQIKKWRREKKVKLIEAVNPTWKNLQT